MQCDWILSISIGLEFKIKIRALEIKIETRIEIKNLKQTEMYSCQNIMKR